MKKCLFFLSMLLTLESFATVRILTFHYNQPDILEMQYKTLKAFLKDDFELIVFNDAKTVENEQGIESVCTKYGIQCVRFEQQWHITDPQNAYLKARLEEPSTVGVWGWNATTSIEEIAQCPSVRHSHVIQYALDHYGYDHDDIVVIMDGDNMPIKPVSIRELLGSYDFVGFDQWQDPQGNGRKQNQLSPALHYERLWVVLIAFRPAALPNVRELQFNVDVVSGQHHFPNNTISDTGASMYKYFQKYPDLKIRTYLWQDSGTFREYFKDHELKALGFDDCFLRFINNIRPGNVQFFIYEHFMHFAAVSALTGEHEHKMHCLREFIEEILK